MARVVLTNALTQYTGGEAEMEIDAPDVRGLMRALSERFPALKPQLDHGVAVAIDGQIYQDDWLQPIPPASEVYLLPQIKGG